MSQVQSGQGDMRERPSGQAPLQSSRPQPEDAAALQETISSLNLDVVRELQHFRQWYQADRGAPTAAPARPPSRTSTSSSGATAKREERSQTTPPARTAGTSVPRRSATAAVATSPTAPATTKPMVEDLDDEWSGRVEFPIPIPLALAGVTVAALIAGMGVSWLLSPRSPDRPAATAQSRASTDRQHSLDLTELPLLPVDPDSADRVRPSGGRELDIARADASERNERLAPNYRPSQVGAGSPTTRNQFDSPELAIRPAARTTTGTLHSTLGANLGEGNFVVLMTYQDDSSLARARQVEPSAFVKRLGDRTYVQLASFRQLEHARYMADQLSREGLAVVVSQ